MRLLVTALATALVVSPNVLAQQYPTQQVTLVIPYGAGGSTDVVGRQLAEALQQRWGQTVVVENHPGAGSMVGTARVAQSAPDGYTLLFTTGAYVTAPAIYDDLPFDPVEDVAPIAMVGYSPFLLTAGAGVEAETFEEFLEEARAREMFMATAGLGSSTHFAAELFSANADLPVTAVHYGGGAPAMTDLMGGHADLYVGSIAAVINNVQAGQIKGLAVLGSERSPALPDVPSTSEAGIEGLDVKLWMGLFTSGGTPAETVAQINADVNDILQSEEFGAVLAHHDTLVDIMTPEEFSELVVAELDLWRELAEERDITAD